MALGLDSLSDMKMVAPRFNPYANNGGTILAISGEDFAVIASDTRLITGYSIYTRDQSKLFELNKTSVLGCTGCWCDTLTFTRQMTARLQIYGYENNREMSTPSISQMISNMLYSRRFFPYYVSNILVGLDGEGRGCVYDYDPVGCFERITCSASGSAGPFLQPLLDSQVSRYNVDSEIVSRMPPLTVDAAVALAKDGFVSAAERDINTGDRIDIRVITRDGIKQQFFELRKD